MGHMGKYKAFFKKTDQLSESEIEAMANIYLKYYAASNADQVKSDLTDKSEVLMLFYDDALVGFTTLLVYEREWQHQVIRVVYSGDTIVEREHWGQQALAFAWITRMGELMAEKPDVPLYWFVIIKGHRTYKYLHTFGKSFYPHWTIDRSDLKPLADVLARERFGEDYNEVSGVVEFKTSKGHLKDEIAYPSDEELSKESVRFFLEKNPGYLQGYELVCLCEITIENMKPLTRRIFLRGQNG